MRWWLTLAAAPMLAGTAHAQAIDSERQAYPQNRAAVRVSAIGSEGFRIIGATAPGGGGGAQSANCRVSAS